MSNRTAIVTGAGRGIGRGIAQSLGKLGWSVVINYNSNATTAEETAEMVRASGGEALTLQANVSSSEDQDRLLAATKEQYGRLDLLVNNAGIAPRQRLDILNTSPESYAEVMAVNLEGPFFLTQKAANHMLSLQKNWDGYAPKIINIGSISAYTSSVSRGEYCISKAGMGMMTALFADRLAEFGINVYEIRPGIIKTDLTSGVTGKYDKLIEDGLTPIKRWGLPDDIGRAVAAIAQDYLPFSTGEIINVDGGFHMHRL